MTWGDQYLTIREAFAIVQQGGHSSFPLSQEEKDQINVAGPFGTFDSINFDAGLSGGTITLLHKVEIGRAL